MEKEKYRKLLSEVFALMRGDALSAALEEKRSSARVDAVQDVMRSAILRSSISKFNGNPYYFGGRIYEEMSWDDFGNLVYDLMRKCKLPNGDYSRVEGVLRVCRRMVSGKQLKPDNAIMVFNNCVFDMNSRMRYDFDRKYVQITQVPYDYDPDEYVFMWKQFLDEVLPNRRMQKVLQEFLGSIFVDRNEAKMETMLILRGSGSNGKSVVFETIMGILGRDNVSNFGLDALVTGSERKKNIAFINGKRLNYCSEIQTLEFGNNSDALKGLISGEPTEARPLYGDNFTAYNIPLLMANANQMPYLRDPSHGMARRICIIPFEVEIPKARQKRDLAKDLRNEYPAIFNWILEGRVRFIANGYKLSDCEALDRVMEEYKCESNTVIKFMYKKNYLCRYVDVDMEPQWMACAILYRRYVRWCKDNDIEPETKSNFGRILTAAGYRKKRVPNGWMYGVYGAPVESHLKYENDKEYMASYRERVSKPFYENGKRWAHGFDGLAACLSVHYSVVQKLMITGKLEGMYYKKGRAHIFELDAVEAVFRQMRENGEIITN